MYMRIKRTAGVAALLLIAGAVASGCWPREPKEDPLVPAAIDDIEPAEADSPAATGAPDTSVAPVLPAEPAAVDTPPPVSEAVEGADAVKVVSADDIAALRSGAGNKPLVVNLWATWCIPCREEMPAFARYFETYGDEDVVFLSLASDEQEAAAQFKAEQKLPFPVYVIGEDVELDDVSEALGVEIDGVLPTTVFFNFGSSPEVHEGKLTFEQLDAKTKSRNAA
ncbi:MAG: redoxin domain-containing protein [Candidatus Hydrogenedentes bacterium]|nr:redoxin domain-containing protein [Candidatus Hydrogenedentota bacterium]